MSRRIVDNKNVSSAIKFCQSFVSRGYLSWVRVLTFGIIFSVLLLIPIGIVSSIPGVMTLDLLEGLSNALVASGLIAMISGIGWSIMVLYKNREIERTQFLSFILSRCINSDAKAHVILFKEKVLYINENARNLMLPHLLPSDKKYTRLLVDDVLSYAEDTSVVAQSMNRNQSAKFDYLEKKFAIRPIDKLDSFYMISEL